MPKGQNNAKINYVGKIFANGWEVKEKLSCKQYQKLYAKNTGDNTKIIKNCHYLCTNEKCGVSTYIEASTLKRNFNKDYLTKCKGCDGQVSEKCFYNNQFRIKNPNQVANEIKMKIPDREEKLVVGKKYGVFTLVSYGNSETYADHQRKANVICSLCNKQKEVKVNHLLKGTATCECFKKRSSGEIYIGSILKSKNINFITEYSFDELRGENGGLLRYDFALLNDNDEPYAFIEYDGEQHFQETGSYFNKKGLVQIHDNRKNKFLKEKNIPLLRISYINFLKSEELIDNFLKKIL